MEVYIDEKPAVPDMIYASYISLFCRFVRAAHSGHLLGYSGYALIAEVSVQEILTYTT